MRRAIPILSVASWLAAAWFITTFFPVVWFMGRFNPASLIFLTYIAFGIILAIVAGVAHFRWARLASFGWSIPAALWFLPSLFVAGGWLVGRGDPCPELNISIIYFILFLLMVCMPVFWGVLCFKRSRTRPNQTMKRIAAD